MIAYRRNNIDVEAITEALNVKPKMKWNKKGKLNPYEFDKGIYILDVKGVKGFIDDLKRVDEDLLNTNFWALLLGVLRNVNVDDALTTGGASYTLYSSYNPTSGAAYLTYGIGTDPEFFTQYVLSSYKGSLPTSISITYPTDRSRISFSGTLPDTAYELGLYQSWSNPAGTYYTTMFGRKSGEWSKGQAIVWNIDFLQPWVRAIADMLYGILLDANVTMVDVIGSSFTARSSGDVNVGSVWLVASPNTVTWSPSLISIPNKVDLTMFYSDFLSSRVARMTFLFGMYTPLSDTAYNTIGLYQSIYDSGGGTHTCCMMVIPLSAPMTFYANRNNLAILRIIVM